MTAKNTSILNYDKDNISPLIKSDVKLLFFQELASTNTYLKENHFNDEHVCVIAKQQTDGRGRLGNSFISNSGIYLSVKITPAISPEKLPCITAFTGVKVCQAIKSACSVEPRIKWVNDIILNDRKICGILAEISADKKSVIIGVGINSDHTVFPKELADKASNLEDICHCKIDKNLLAAKVIDGIISLEKTAKTKHKHLLNEYKKTCCTLGKDVIICDSSPYTAYAQDIDDDCSLLVTDEHGVNKKISFGEVRIRSTHGYI